MSAKLTLSYIKTFIKNLEYDLINEEHINSTTKITIKDIKGYYYITTFNRLSQGNMPNAFNKSNPYTIQNINLWCKINSKPFKLLSCIYDGANSNLLWKCSKENCGEEFESSWGHIYNNRGCPYCSSHRLSISNCLATKNPELAKEWHSTLNGELTPYDVLPNSNRQYWWQCSKNYKHVWQSNIVNRNNNNGCPFCNGTFPSEDYNLLIDNPILCEEWNYNKNNKPPSEYTPGSGIEVWWKCKKCGNEWESRIVDRNKKNIGCPKCNLSKGETKLHKYLLNNNWIQITQKEYNKLKINNNENYFIPQKKYKDLIGLYGGNLSYDFYLPKYNLVIEYQGQQHEKYIYGNFHKSKKDFEKQQEHDRRKREYAKNNNINLLEIWYWDFDNIEEILTGYLNQHQQQSA